MTNFVTDATFETEDQKSKEPVLVDYFADRKSKRLNSSHRN